LLSCPRVREPSGPQRTPLLERRGCPMDGRPEPNPLLADRARAKKKPPWKPGGLVVNLLVDVSDVSPGSPYRFGDDVQCVCSPLLSAQGVTDDVERLRIRHRGVS
jgi:hypothetical protein